MPDPCCLTVPGQADQLETIRQFMARVTHQIGLDECESFRVQMAVDEACANVIEHAYGDTPGDIAICCQWTAEELTVQIQDHGRPFDPQSVPQPNLSCDLESRTPGGLGLYFMYKMMDDVCFEFGADGCNTLTMSKRIKSGPTC